GERGDLRLERLVALLARGELHLLQGQELETLLVEAVGELALLLGGVLEGLLVELERVRVRLDADLDRPAGLVGVDVVERGVGRRALGGGWVDDAVGPWCGAAHEARWV